LRYEKQARELVRRYGVVTRIVIAALSVTSLFALWPPSRFTTTTRAAQQATFLLNPSHKTVDLAAGTVQMDVEIQKATAMAAFQFTLRYDRGVLAAESATQGPFLATTGRTLICLPPLIDGEGGPGTVLFGCASGAGAGVDGDGVIATVVFHLTGGSDSAIDIEKTSMGNADGQNLCAQAVGACTVEDGSITVTGGNPAAKQGLAPTPTPAGDQNAPATAVTGGAAAPTAASAAPTAAASNTDPASGTTSVPADGAGASADGSSSGTGETSPGGNAGQVAAAGAAPRVGRLGTGPPPAAHPWWDPFLPFVLGAAGVVAITIGSGLRMRRQD
jgi:hypothetical protein